MAVFTSTVRALSHTTLNWDTQLNADMAALETLFTYSLHVDRSSDGSVTVTDFNGVTAPGTYPITASGSYTHFPPGAYGYGVLEVVRSASYVVQTYHDLQFGRFFRTFDASAWSSWTRLPTVGDLQTQQHGAVTLGASVANGSRFSASASVSLTGGLFAVAPIVQVTLVSGSAAGQNAQVNSITTSGFIVAAVRDTSFSAGLVVNWSAFTPS